MTIGCTELSSLEIPGGFVGTELFDFARLFRGSCAVASGCNWKLARPEVGIPLLFQFVWVTLESRRHGLDKPHAFVAGSSQPTKQHVQSHPQAQREQMKIAQSDFFLAELNV